MHFEVIYGLLDRAGPFKTEVTAARRNGNFGQRICLDAGTVQIQLGIFKSVSPTSIFRDQLNPDNIAVKRVRSIPVRNVDNAMIKPCRQAHEKRLHANFASNPGQKRRMGRGAQCRMEMQSLEIRDSEFRLPSSINPTNVFDPSLTGGWKPSAWTEN
jgi:hypothetical protein